MSLFGALFSGVTGLNANSQAVGIISDNISNVNTVGYKRTDGQFTTLITREATDTQYTPGGVQNRPRPLVDQQGLLQSSASETDLAVQGNGLFIVNDTASNTDEGQFLFTRAGSFTTDSDGNLVNAAGYFLKGFRLDTNGALPTDINSLFNTETVNIRGLSGTAEATTSVTFRANLKSSQTISASAATYAATVAGTNMASGTVTPDFSRGIQIFDSKGGTRTLTYSFLKHATTPNLWHVEIYATPASDVTVTAPLINGQIATGVIGFNTNGTFNTATTTLPASATITYAAALGLANQSVTLNFGSNGGIDGMTQFDSVSTLNSTDINGAIFGNLTSVNITGAGVVVANFDNGVIRNIAQIPLATFANPNGLQAVTGNAYIPTDASSGVNIQLAGAGGAGLIKSASLESSNVDLASEFTDLIITQRAFSAATRIVTTADEMLEELVRIKR